MKGSACPRRLIPRRIYYGAVGTRKRYFALKLPLAVDAETVTFAYVDPGHQYGFVNCTPGGPRMGRFGMRSARKGDRSG